MNQFRADLHIHSRFSRATSKHLNPRNLAAWARVKGLDVVGTGDFTHPGWLDELKEHMEEDATSGLYRLKSGKHLDREIPWLAGFELPDRARFMLQGEISSIYKRGGKVRKVHNLVFMPSFQAAEKFNLKLGQVGNLKSDGRPILGLDSRNLLEMVLETDSSAFLVPAHIWTPWFSLFGSKSGFDAIEECFGDLASEIFALETGLSSDPEMNWMISALDRFRLISNSDAHSGEKLAREANLFSGDRSYEGIFRALRGEALGHKFLGTVEFFPEEGKYHLDGHRDCGVVLEPQDTLSRGGTCPVCGKPLTVGVLNRVLTLADREVPVRPEGRPDFVSLIPLAELASEIVGTGPATGKVRDFLSRCIVRFGSELDLLMETPEEDLRKFSPLLAEGVSRMRRGEVFKQPGYDGRFGVITVFSEKERQEFKGGRLLHGVAPRRSTPKATPKVAPKISPETAPEISQETGPEEGRTPSPPPDGVVYNEAQRRAMEAGPGPVLVLAGPGTGKTQTLMGRIETLLTQGENARHILAVTFTRRAAGELGERLAVAYQGATAFPRADTLHALALEYWARSYDHPPVLLDEEGARRVFRGANSGTGIRDADKAWNRIALAREQLAEPAEAEMFHRYVKLKESWNLADYTDLLEFWLEQIRDEIYLCPYTHILVDEVQDLSALQTAVVTSLVPKGGQGFFAIGDPCQSIYGFRGALPDAGSHFKELWPELDVVGLTENYRSAQAVLNASAPLAPNREPLMAARPLAGAVHLFQAPTAEREAAWIGERVKALLGETSHSLTDGRQGEAQGLEGTLSPGDVAVLVRFKALIPSILRTLDRLGVPCAAPGVEVFWNEPRVARILDAAGRFLGIAPDPELADFSCPDKVLAKGPQGISAYLKDSPAFDQLFWKSRAFKELTKAWKEQGGWAGLLNWVHLQSELELVRRRSEKVQIMSLHAAKGLEFRAVFLPALEDGILPFAGPSFLAGKAGEGDKADEAEERRLLYVGMTRASEALYLSRAEKRSLFGREVRLGASKFLETLPLDTWHKSVDRARTERKEKQLPLL